MDGGTSGCLDASEGDGDVGGRRVNSHDGGGDGVARYNLLLHFTYFDEFLISS